MELDQLIINKYIAEINNSLENFANNANEKLSIIADDLNRCQANLVILEKKIEGSQEK